MDELVRARPRGSKVFSRFPPAQSRAPAGPGRYRGYCACRYRPSFQARQIGRDGAEFLRIEGYHRHVVAGLERLRIGDPGCERTARGLKKSGGDIFPAADEAEVERVWWDGRNP